MRLPGRPTVRMSPIWPMRVWPGLSSCSAICRRGNSSTVSTGFPNCRRTDRAVEEFKWAPDSSLIAYRADQAINDVPDLYTTAPDQS